MNKRYFLMFSLAAVIALAGFYDFSVAKAHDGQDHPAPQVVAQPSTVPQSSGLFAMFQNILKNITQAASSGEITSTQSASLLDSLQKVWTGIASLFTPSNTTT